MSTKSSNIDECYSLAGSDQEKKIGKQENSRRLDKYNLYVRGLSKKCTQVMLDDLFKSFGVIVQSRVYGDGIGFVRFASQDAARHAYLCMNRRVNPTNKERLIVHYAYERDRNNARVIHVGNEKLLMTINKNTNNVYLRDFPECFKRQDFVVLCSYFGELDLNYIKYNVDMAFVRFVNAEDANRAICGLNGRIIPPWRKPLLVKLANLDPKQKERANIRLLDPPVSLQTREDHDCDDKKEQSTTLSNGMCVSRSDNDRSEEKEQEFRHWNNTNPRVDNGMVSGHSNSNCTGDGSRHAVGGHTPVKNQPHKHPCPSATSHNLNDADRLQGYHGQSPRCIVHSRGASLSQTDQQSNLHRKMNGFPYANQLMGNGAGLAMSCTKQSPCAIQSHNIHYANDGDIEIGSVNINDANNALANESYRMQSRVPMTDAGFSCSYMNLISHPHLDNSLDRAANTRHVIPTQSIFQSPAPCLLNHPLLSCSGRDGNAAAFARQGLRTSTPYIHVGGKKRQHNVPVHSKVTPQQEPNSWRWK